MLRAELRIREEHLPFDGWYPNLSIGASVMLRDGVDLWAAGRLDFADAYLAALARRISGSGGLSFDRGFDRVPGVTRVDPAR